MTTRVMFYVQHLLGIGHLARASLICAGLVRQGFEVKMVMGGVPVEGFPGPSIDVEYLPVLKAGCMAFNDLTDEHGIQVNQQYLDNRRDKLLALFDDYQPDILIIEAFPFGRRQMRFELIPLLEKAKAVSRPLVIAGSVRDIVQEKKKPKRLEETVTVLKQYFDMLLVHGDPDFVRLDETFPLADRIENITHYTGIVSAGIPPLSGPSYDVVVSAGGGAAGQHILLNAARARPFTNLSKARWCFITGPNLAPEISAKIQDEACENVTIETHRTDFRALLAHARLSVSQAGYNTTADLMRAGCPSVLVPFSTGGETEQTHRATRLAERGLACMISEGGLSPQKLAALIDQADAVRTRPLQARMPALDGADQTAILLQNALKISK